MKSDKIAGYFVQRSENIGQNFRTVRGATAEEFKNSLVKISEVATVEDFWRVYHHIPTVDALAAGASYHLMQASRQPLWEDEANCHGGTWRFRVAKQHSVSWCQHKAIVLMQWKLESWHSLMVSFVLDFSIMPLKVNLCHLAAYLLSIPVIRGCT